MTKTKTNRDTSEEKFAEIFSTQFSSDDIHNMMITNLRILKKKEDIAVKDILDILNYFTCKKCGNCCKECNASLSDEDINNFVKISGNSFYGMLSDNPYINEIKSPCLYYIKNRCEVNNIKPQVCKIYPFSLQTIGFLTICSCPMGNDIIKEYINYNNINLSKYNKLLVDKASNEFNDVVRSHIKVSELLQQESSINIFKDKKHNQQIMIVPYESTKGFLKYLKSTKKQ